MSKAAFQSRDFSRRNSVIVSLKYLLCIHEFVRLFTDIDPGFAHRHQKRLLVQAKG